MKASIAVSLLVMALSGPTVAQAQGTVTTPAPAVRDDAAGAATTTGRSRSQVPPDQRPTATTPSAAPECGAAAESDTSPNARTPCTPKNVVPR